MKTKITTGHEEKYSNSDKTLGVLVNIDENGKRIDSFTYIYRKGLYIFFNTIMDLNDYLFYGDCRLNRAYLNEEDFDNYYDAPYIDGLFNEKLSWSKKNLPLY